MGVAGGPPADQAAYTQAAAADGPAGPPAGDIRPALLRCRDGGTPAGRGGMA
eukprot:gene32024-61989_t